MFNARTMHIQLINSNVTFLLLLLFSSYFCDWNAPTVTIKDVTSHKGLTCLCNDNNQCVMKRPSVNISGFDDYTKPMGFCVTSIEGRCYTAKDINIWPSISHSRYRRFINSFGDNDGAIQENEFLEKYFDNEGKRVNVEHFIHVRYGCLSSDQKITFACNGHLVKHLVPKTIACCNSSDFCNARLMPEFFHHSSNEDAVRTAFRNQKFFQKFDHQIKKKKLNPGLNIGPQLLNDEGALEVENPVTSDPTRKPSSKEMKLFYFILIISFTIVAVILFSTLMVVCFIYNCRVRRNQKRVLRTLMLRKRQNRGNNTFNDKNGFVTNTIKISVESNLCQSAGKMNPKTLGSGTTYQTLSTNSTQNAESLTESQPLNGVQSMRLRQQTISSQVHLQKLIGTGRFSDVWIGSWHGESVLVKIIIPDDQLAQSLWRRTALLHRSMLLRHHTIQGLMAVDWIDYPGPSHSMQTMSHLPPALITTTSPRAMLIGELHPWGSLQDLMATHWWCSRATQLKPTGTGASDIPDAVTRVFTLQRNVVDHRMTAPTVTITDELMLKIVLRMALSITQGLCFLHSEFAGTRGKPALAHRNLKPSNIFVRSDWTCCIGDIGFAVRPPPCPLPMPLTELHTLYKQYVDQIDRSSRTNGTSSTGIDRPSREDSVDSERTGLIRNTQTMDSVGMNAPGIVGALNGELHNSKLTVAKAELLDWWPVGGLCPGTIRYSAPELIARSVDPFCFEAHQKADIYALGLILWELLAWALPQTLPYRHEPCEQCHSSNSSAQSAALIHSDHVDDQSACGKHCLSHVAYEVELRAYNQTYETATWTTSNESKSNSMEPSYRAINQSNCQLKEFEAIAIPQQVEPDLQTMYRLVCEAQIRPQLPRSTCACCTGFVVQPQPHPGWLSTEPTIGLGQYGDLGRLRTSVPRCHSTTPECATVRPNKATDSASRSSTSSGASSLQGTHSGSQSTRTERTHAPVSSTELTQLMWLVARHWASLLPECWTADPDARLTAQRVRKGLQKLADHLDLFRMSRSETRSATSHADPTRHAIRYLTSPQRSTSTTIKES